jgi:hypothetical protein
MYFTLQFHCGTIFLPRSLTVIFRMGSSSLVLLLFLLLLLLLSALSGVRSPQA